MSGLEGIFGVIFLLILSTPFVVVLGMVFVGLGGMRLLRPLLNWVHEVTAPPREIRVGDRWKVRSTSPWDSPAVVVEVKDGWVRYRYGESESTGIWHSTTERIFRDCHKYLYSEGP